MGSESLNPFPSGWFIVAFSDELKRGKVLSKTFMGQEIVLFRTEEGHPAALDAHCPHLGAHLGYGGTVDGNCIRCPFHHFEFHIDGSCDKSKHLKARNWLLVERDGFIFLYHGNPDKKHPLPNLTEEGWKLRSRYFSNIKSHPQQTMENNVDLIHFITVHKMVSANLTEISGESDVLSGILQVKIHLSLFGKLWKLWTNSLKKGEKKGNFSLAEMYGLGYYLIKSSCAFNTEIAILILATPINKESLQFNLMVFTRTAESASLFHKGMGWLLSSIVFSRLVHFVKQDLPIWNHQRYIPHPPLLPAESSIAIFRKWAKRFYE